MILTFLFFASILVPGIEESVPNTDDKTFQILISPDIVKNFTYVYDEGLFFTIASDTTEERLLIQIPKNFPIPTAHQNGTDIYPRMFAISSAGFELPLKMTEGDCFFNYDISLQNSTGVELLYRYQIAYEIYVISRTIDSDCFDRVFATFPSLKDQLASNVPVNQIKCNNGMVLVQRDNEKLACVYFETAQKLNWKVLNK